MNKQVMKDVYEFDIECFERNSAIPKFGDVIISKVEFRYLVEIFKSMVREIESCYAEIEDKEAIIKEVFDKIELVEEQASEIDLELAELQDCTLSDIHVMLNDKIKTK